MAAQHLRRRVLSVECLESRFALASLDLEQFQLFTSAALTTSGLTGSYVNRSLRDYAPHDDWRSAQSISGTRIDQVSFETNDWGSRAAVGITGGTDADWDNYSVQWDGFIQVLADNLALRNYSDDGSRLWVDANRNGQFEATSAEFADNGWGAAHGALDGPLLTPLPKGLYPIRIQYEAGTGGNVLQLRPGPPLVMRIAYLIPANRTPQAEGVKNLQRMAQWYTELLSDQMDRYGYGAKTIAFETESDGVTPKVHVLTLPKTDDYYRADDQQNEGNTIYNRVLEGASAVGATPLTAGEVWLYVHEAQQQLPDGDVVGGVALGAGVGNGYSGGVAVVGAAKLSLADPEGLADERAYDGLIIPEIGTFPLTQDTSFPWFEGQTVSSVASSFVGAALHELTHGLGIGHEFRNDANFHGSLMGNGFRGIRSFIWPQQFPADHVQLGPAEALGLRFSRYLNAGQNVTDHNVPVINTFTVNPQPQDGHLQVSFTATDNSQLAAALLARSGGYVSEASLSGTAASFTFQIPDYEPGEENSFRLTMIDAQGNRVAQTVKATPIAPPNRAPLPLIKASTYLARPDQPVALDAGGSRDPDHAAGLLSVEWDLNGDGAFDTAPTTNKTFSTTFSTEGVHKIYARITDPAGAKSLSAPITVRVVAPSAPSISDIEDQIAAEDGTLNVAFTIGDADTPLVTLEIAATADNAALLPPASLTMTGLGANRNLRIVPAHDRNGVANVAIAVSDGDSIHSTTFTVTVTAVNDPPTLSLGPSPSNTDEDGLQCIDWTSEVSPGPPDEATQLVDLTVTNNNPSLFAVQPHADELGRVCYTPAPNVAGTATITLLIQDDGGTTGGGSDVLIHMFTITITKPRPWYNVRNRLDGNDSRGAVPVSSLDALIIFNALNAFPSSMPPGGTNDNGNFRVLAAAPIPFGSPLTVAPFFYDTTGDNFISALDALLVINAISAAGAGEAAPARQGIDALFPEFGSGQSIPQSETNDSHASLAAWLAEGADQLARRRRRT